MMKSVWFLLILLGSFSVVNAQLVGSITQGKVASGDIALNTRLVLPDTPLKKRPPVLIMAHGPGRHATWTTYQSFIRRFTNEGFAVVFYDKRGTGGSGGEATEVTLTNSKDVFDSLSNDIAAVAEWTKMQARIDSSRIGILGYSAGGWVAPLAANKNPSIAFTVVLSSPIYSVAQQALHKELTQKNMPEISMDTLHRKMQHIASDTLSFNAFKPVEALQIPSLWLYGEKDSRLSVPFNTQLLDSLLLADPEKPLRYRLYQNTNHSLYDVKTKIIAPYASDIKRWVLEVLY